MSFVAKRAYAIAEKEFYHIFRDPFILILSFGLPIFMVLVFGVAIEFNVKNLHLAVYDGDHTQSSYELTEIFGRSKYFIIHHASTPEQASEKIFNNIARAALIIPGGFERTLFSGTQAQVQVLVDGSDNSTVIPILSYLSSIQQLAAKRLADFEAPPKVAFKTKFLFNSELNSRWFIVPGLIVAVMAILSVLLTSLTITQEWEHGSMELLLATPAEPLEIIVGKLIPYAILCLVAVGAIYLISRIVFSVPFRGSHLVFGLGSCLFLLTSLAHGLLISVVSKSQQVAIQLAMLTGFLPAQLLSGFILPIESMPQFFHYFTMIFPARWFMVISRQSYLTEATFEDLALPFIILGILTGIMIFLIIKNFKKDLEL